MAGVRVLEVASHVFVPVAGAILAEWGAEVTKVEHPVTGDAYRGLVTFGLHTTHHGVDVNFQYANRGKQSIGIDLTTEQGRELVLRLGGPERRLHDEPAPRDRWSGCGSRSTTSEPPTRTSSTCGGAARALVGPTPTGAATTSRRTGRVRACRPG